MSEAEDLLKEPTFYGTIRSAIEDGKSPEEAVVLVIDSDDFRDRMVKVLAARVRNMLRVETAKAEARAMTAWKKGNTATARQELVGRGFALPDGSIVNWEDATAGQHLARANWQHNRAEAIRRDATLHRVAAQIIEDAGVTCLGEIESLAPWPELAEAAGIQAIEAE